MADLVGRVQREVGMPVIDGVAAAVVQVEGLVRLAWAPASTATSHGLCLNPTPAVSHTSHRRIAKRNEGSPPRR